ncbi:EamA/RhaT family transporter [Herbiconiux sp. CPCC 205763]|uniref:EamA/RhaT family transporter n=1 Tax=Herbiconiux aconitum TaxID=2970913 RepID=A0ABT2GQG3_9MICO|nr:EamA family transporter [Herbiconiux aconitum]MCS5718460.1 EamA/RhaT family transporter [Herbiconiux aconitum]
MTILLGLSGALAYGFADFLGGLASRSIRPIVATAWAALIGLVPLFVGLAVLGGQFTTNALLWGVIAGVSGSIGVLMLYTALAVGPMSVLSPVTSVVSVIVPVSIGLVFAGSQLSALGVVAIIVAVVAVALVGAVKDRSGSRLTGRGLVTAGVAGCGFGGLVLAYAATAPEDGLAPLVVARIVQAAVMWIGVAVVVSRERGRQGVAATLSPGRSGRLWVQLAICGTLDASANVLIQAALHSGATADVLPVVSVLNALYPIGTVILAAIVLRERLTLLQIIGLALALTASAVLATT